MTNETKIHLRLDETKDAEKLPRLSERLDSGRYRSISCGDEDNILGELAQKILNEGYRSRKLALENRISDPNSRLTKRANIIIDGHNMILEYYSIWEDQFGW